MLQSEGTREGKGGRGTYTSLDVDDVRSLSSPLVSAVDHPKRVDHARDPAENAEHQVGLRLAAAAVQDERNADEQKQGEKHEGDCKSSEKRTSVGEGCTERRRFLTDRDTVRHVRR